MKILKKTNDGCVVEMSRYELAVILGYDALYKKNDVIILSEQLAKYHRLRESIEKLAGIIKLEKRS